MTVPFAVAAIAILVAVSVLAALSRSLLEVSETALERELEARGRLERGRWVVGRLAQVEWAVAFARTAGRIGFTVIVLALVAGFDEPLTPARLAIAWVVAVAALWLLTTAAAGAFARHAPARVIASFLPTLRIFYVLLAPFRLVADLVDGLVARILGVSGTGGAEERAEDELASAIEETQRHGLIDEQAAAILENAVEFGDTTVGAVMTPRPAIEGIEYTDDIAAIRDFARRSGHSRIPVYRGSLDHVDGILYVKDLVPLLGADAAGFRLRPFLRAPQRVPESKPLREQLRDFQQSKVHFAVVVDEFGGTSGILTIEDVIEELVGEIRDEHEPATDVHPVALRAADGWIEASGRLPIGDLGAALDAELPEDEGYETVAGFVLARFGSIPRRGDAFESQGIRFEVLEATPSAVIKVRARRASAD
jgi:CBS domain containing-hemolysin-like protein